MRMSGMSPACCRGTFRVFVLLAVDMRLTCKPVVRPLPPMWSGTWESGDEGPYVLPYVGVELLGACRVGVKRDVVVDELLRQTDDPEPERWDAVEQGVSQHGWERVSTSGRLG